jgi:phosphoesterase RecJ-like protein
MEKRVRLLVEAIHSSERLVLTTHQNPDGDGIGAELALHTGLMQLGKSATILNDDVTPDEYGFLDRYGVIRTYSPAQHERVIQSADMAILLDADEPGRTGRLESPLLAFAGATAVVDHHRNGNWGDLRIVDAEACSTTALVRLLLEKLSIGLSRTIAEALYVGVLVDTLSFRNANTDSACLALAAELVAAGADPSDLWQQVFGQRPFGRLKLEGEFLDSLHASSGGRIIWGHVDAAMLQRHGQPESAIEGFVERELDVRGAEMAILFVEESRNRTRVSFRSREPLAVDELARELGGGGHRLASGTILEGELNEVVPVVLRHARKLLKAAWH